MDEIEPPPSDPQRFTALERAQAISRALAEAARRARFSSKARGAHQKNPFQSRRGAKAMRMLRRILFGLMVVAPNLAAIVYYGVLASDQFESETQFTVSSGAVPRMDGLGSVTGVPPTVILQDTQIVTAYIESRAMVELLDKQLGLRAIYGSDQVDWGSRFSATKPIEKFVDFWGKMARTSISLPSGIVKLTVRAYSPAGAKRIAEAIVAQCETLINTLNDRMRTDTIQASERDLQRAGERLTQVRVEMEKARNAEGLIDVHEQSSSLYQLLSEQKLQLYDLQSDYRTQSAYVSEQAPQMRVLKSKISALQAEVDNLQAQITESERKSALPTAEKPLSDKINRFQNLELEQKISEARYASASASVTTSRALAERKMMYLHEIVTPALPQAARYPKRWLSIGLTLAATLAAFGAVVGAIGFVRNNMA